MTWLKFIPLTSANSTVTAQILVDANSTSVAANAGFHFDSSGALQIAGSFSASVTSSTQVSASSVAGRVTTDPYSTSWAGNAGFHFDSSGAVQISGTINASASTTVNVSSLAGIVTIAGNSTVMQGTSPWVIGGNSSVRANLSSTAADNPVQVSGNSTVVIASFTPTKLNIGSTAADNAVLVSGNSTVAPLSGSVWTIQGNSTVVVASGNSSVTITAGNSSVIITSFTPTKLNIGSTAADNAVLISGNSTAFQGTSPWVVAEAMQSSAAPSSVSSGVIVRQVVDAILTTASTSAFATSTSFTIQSSAASVRSYITAYSILTTNAGPTQIAFYSSGTMLWPMVFAAASSMVTGANLAVGAPAYLFRSNAAEALTLQTNGSSVAGWSVAVSYFRAV